MARMTDLPPGAAPKAAAEEVAVTGAAGRVGAAVCDELIAADHRVRMFSHRPSGRTQAIPVDVTRRESLAGAFDGCSWIIHCAGTFHAPDDELATVNTLGTRHVAEEAMAAGVRYFLLVSTAAADSGAVRTDPYVRSKADAEQAVRSCGPPAGIVRAGWVIAPADREAHAKLWPPSARQVVLRGVRVPVVALRDLAVLLRVASEREIHGVIEGFTGWPTQEELVEYAEAISGRSRHIVRVANPRLLERLAGMRGGGVGAYRDTYLRRPGHAVPGESAWRAHDLIPGHLSWKEAVAGLWRSTTR